MSRNITALLDGASLYVYSNNNTYRGTFRNNSAGEIVLDSPGAFRFTVADVERVTIDADGLVGINKTAPVSLLDITKTAIGVSQSDAYGLSLINTTAATNGNPQYSPPLRFRGNAWDGAATAAHDYRFYVVPSNGANKSHFDMDINDTGGYITRFRVWFNGERNIKGKVSIVHTTDTIAVATAQLDVSKESIGTSQSDTNGLKLQCPTAATATSNQYSPPIVWEGSFWNPTGLNSVTSDFRTYVSTVSGNNPLGSGNGSLVIESQQGGDGYKEYVRINPISGVGIKTPNSQVRYVVGGTLYSSPNSAEATSGDVIDLYSYTLPNNTVRVNGDRVQMKAMGWFDTTYAGPKTLILEAGNTKIVNLTNITNALGAWTIDASLYAAGATANFIYDSVTTTSAFISAGTPTTYMYPGILTSGTSANDTNIVLRGQSGVVVSSFSILFHPTQY